MATTVESNKALIRRFVEEVLNQGKYNIIEGFYATPELASHIKGEAPLLRQGFPDLHFVVEDLIGEGDKVVVRYTITGTNTGPFMGRPPSGKTATWGGVTVTTVKAGKFQEEWVYPDRLSVMQQIGMVPSSMPTHAAQTEAAHSH